VFVPGSRVVSKIVKPIRTLNFFLFRAKVNF
jgi:hypothetical protein